jgi:hypothetical protein
LIGLSWKVCEAGYQWMKSGRDSQGELVLMPVKPWPTHEYEPLKSHTGLFREFAGLKGDPEEFRRFADRYGSLCLPSAESAIKPNAFETLAFWKAQSKAIHTALALWDAVRAGEADPDELARVAEAIDLGRQDRVEFHFTFDRKRRRFEDVPVPADLIGAIWAQFADAVTNHRQYRRCPAPGCGRWYELSPTAKGPDKNHCSVACKQRAYRLRKDRALEFFKNRRTAEQIAEELETPVETVKRWLAGVPQDSGGESTADDIPCGRPGLDLDTPVGTPVGTPVDDIPMGRPGIQL